MIINHNQGSRKKYALSFELAKQDVICTFEKVVAAYKTALA